MNRIWSRETLRYVDGWACRPGKPEDTEEEREEARRRRGTRETILERGGGVLEGAAGGENGIRGGSGSERAVGGDEVDVESGLLPVRRMSADKSGGGVREKQS